MVMIPAETIEMQAAEMADRLKDKNAEIARLREVVATAAAFRGAMIDSGALNSVPQNKYFPQLRALETALANLSG